jgi:hypothetical protein
MMRGRNSVPVVFAFTIGCVVLLSCTFLLPKPVLASNESAITVTQTFTIQMTATATVTRASTAIDEPPFDPSDFVTNAPDVVPLPPHPMDIPQTDGDPLFMALSLTPIVMEGFLAVMGIMVSLRPRKLRRVIPLPLNRLSGYIRTRRF